MLKKVLALSILNTLNDYFLARGFANIYISGVGTAGSNGFMTSGDYAQVEKF